MHLLKYLPAFLVGFVLGTLTTDTADADDQRNVIRTKYIVEVLDTRGPSGFASADHVRWRHYRSFWNRTAAERQVARVRRLFVPNRYADVRIRTKRVTFRRRVPGGGREDWRSRLRLQDRSREARRGDSR